MKLWDGNDLDFPVLKKFPSMPSFGFPPMLVGVRGIIEATYESDPLNGVTSLVGPLDEDAFRYSLQCYPRKFRRKLSSAKFATVTYVVSETEYKRRIVLSNGIDLGLNTVKKGSVAVMHNVLLLYRRFEWSITLRLTEGHVGVRIPTDSSGILCMLRDREKNGTRRSPLLHWVTEHARRNRVDEEATHEVRAYLRGSRKCNWRGYLVEIRESELEREQLVNR
jgi:hypothetical protein